MADNQRFEIVLLPPNDPFFIVRDRYYSVKRKAMVENIVENLGLGAPDFKNLEKLYLYVLENFEIIHARMCHLDTYSCKIKENAIVWDLHKKTET
jgi:ribosomal protein S18